METAGQQRDRAVLISAAVRIADELERANRLKEAELYITLGMSDKARQILEK